MKQIKTIYKQSTIDFDEQVNDALAEGWTLVRRTFDANGFLAELEIDKEEPAGGQAHPSEKKKPVDAPPLNCQGCRHWPKPTMVEVQEPCRSCGGVFTGYKNWEPRT